MNQKSLVTFAALTIISAPTFGNTGQGILAEGDVCSAAYIIDASQNDDCLPGLSCIPLSKVSVFNPSNELGGVCCDKYSINSVLGTNCYGCSDTWTTTNTRYQTRKRGYQLCMGYEHIETEYQCANGYYGTPTNTTSGCTACPANATCSAGNNSTFICKKGYYKNGTSCTQCPSSGGTVGTTSAAGATKITDCYLPSGTSFSDSTGSGTYTGNCYYK